MTENTEANKSFLIDVTPVYAGEKKEISFSYTLSTDSLVSGCDVSFITPVKAFGTIRQTAAAASSAEGYVELSINVSTDIKAACARCLEEVKTPFSVSAVYGITPFLQNAEENETCLMTENGFLDIREIADTLFVLNLPSKYLCIEDCKGLCPACGVNLNTHTCNCETKEVDPRLSALKNFFKG